MSIIHGQSEKTFSPEVVEKIQNRDIFILNKALSVAPLVFETGELHVIVSNVCEVYPTYRYKKSIKKHFACFFMVKLENGSDSESIVYVSLGNFSNSWYIGDDNRNFDKYLSNGYLKKEYRQPILDSISAWILKLP